jgi:hypothetical protein
MEFQTHGSTLETSGYDGLSTMDFTVSDDSDRRDFNGSSALKVTFLENERPKM